MSLHSQEQRLQLGRFGGGQGLRTESREHEESETRNGDPENEMDLLSVETVGFEVQLRWWGGGRGELRETVREVELGSYSRRENEMLLMEMVAREEGKQWIWNEG